MFLGESNTAKFIEIDHDTQQVVIYINSAGILRVLRTNIR